MRWIPRKTAPPTPQTPLTTQTWSSLSAITGAPHTLTGIDRRGPERASARATDRALEHAAARLPDPPSTRKAVVNAQKVRLRRFYLAAGFSAIYFAVLTVFWWFALVDTRTLALAAAYIVVNCAVFYSAFRIGWNTLFGDASLTMPMTLSALIIMLIVIFFAPATQIIFAPFMFCAMAFAAVRVPATKLMMVGFAALAGCALIILSHQASLKNPALLQLESLHWLVLAVTLPAFALLATRIHTLRHALVSAGAHIKLIEKTAQRDPLTGCYGRKYVFAKLETHCRAANEFDQPLCVAVLDIDHFKNVNDTLGHLGGDVVLREFVFLCQTTVRETDIFGRYGGEEFLLIMPETSLLTAVDICERIRALVAAQDWGLPGRKSVTVSVGVTRYEPAESALEFFSRADAAMYAAKQDGRNQVVLQEQQSFSRHD